MNCALAAENGQGGLTAVGSNGSARKRSEKPRRTARILVLESGKPVRVGPSAELCVTDVNVFRPPKQKPEINHG